jgi:3-hydroxyacyl-CoA dehydrogenase/enoyl-CoA hydratase/carnithine racemase
MTNLTLTEASVPEERVTHSHLQLVELPLHSGTLALITLDNGFDHTKPNALGLASVLELDAAITQAYETPGVVAVGITGTPFVFAAGADVKTMRLIRTKQQARDITQLGHRVFSRLSSGPVPTFAFINGVALGGALELAVNCTYRTVLSTAAPIGLPECFIGLIPGWGGSWLLPNLIGVDTAVTVIIENPLNQNRILTGAEAAGLGIADVAFDAPDFLEQSLAWAARVLQGDGVVERSVIDRSEETWSRALARGKAIADAKVKGAAPAPYRALELIAKARVATRDEGFAAEDDVLPELLMGEEFRASLYAFDLVQRRARRPVGAPDSSLARQLTKVGIVGAGLMASQLAVLCVRRLEVPVVLTDLDQGRVDKGIGYVHAGIDALQRKGRLSQDRANRLHGLISGSTDKTVFADADLVLEAVFEDMKVKQQVFGELDGIVSPECVLATNTSSLSVTEMAARLQHPNRVVGMHFFNPVAVLPLLEVVRGEQTDDATLATAFATGKTLKKSCVLVKDAPGFVVNRILERFLGEITASVDEGTPVDVADRALNPLGVPMSPFMMLQLVGPAVALHALETLHEAFPDRFPVSENLRRLVASGKAAVVSWDAQGKPYLDEQAKALVEQGSSPQTEDELRERVLSAVAQEIRLLLDDGVVAEVPDVDLCMLLGAGWPFHVGGITPYLDRTGVSERVTGQRFLPRGVASVPEA